MCVRVRLTCALWAILMLGAPAIAATLSNQTDDFESGTQNWTNGTAAPDPVTLPGGPGGAADHYLQISASGVSGAGGKFIAVNVVQWAGDFSGLGEVSVDVRNCNALNLKCRV